MFGNLTPQPPSATPNGYSALALYDLKKNGGNENGEIDPGDSVYSKLLVWIDSNQDGISQPDELHSLQELGIESISLKYHKSPYVDQFGNSFRYESRISYLPKEGDTRPDTRSFDVFLLLAQETADAEHHETISIIGSHQDRLRAFSVIP